MLLNATWTCRFFCKYVGLLVLAISLVLLAHFKNVADPSVTTQNLAEFFFFIYFFGRSLSEPAKVISLP